VGPTKDLDILLFQVKSKRRTITDHEIEHVDDVLDVTPQVRESPDSDLDFLRIED
jgi:hypothetical protein